MTDFRTRLARGDELIGTVLAFASEQTAECVARAGFDWVWIDTEHGPIDLACAQRMIQAVSPSCPAVVRAPSRDPAALARVLDLGPAGVIVPHVDSAEDARAVVRACRYPPHGERSAGIARAQGYGRDLASYLKDAHRREAVIAQIEHIDAVEGIDEIAAVEGLDCALIGPFDLSGSLGRPGDLGHPSVSGAIERVRTACRARGLPLGIFCPTPELAREYLRSGFGLVAVGVDAQLLAGASSELLARTRGS